MFDGKNLSIEGETNHAADSRIINAATAGDEIYLFYRNRHHEDFIYQGRITLDRHEKNTDKPSRFWFSLDSGKARSTGKKQNVLVRERVLCRICWNSKGWTYPTGEAAKLETGSFVSNSGFGHEEWLMNVGWLINGWHYGFLQPINTAFAKWQGRTATILLYTIGPHKQRYYVGRIHDLEVLTPNQAIAAGEEYHERGWFAEMIQQVKDVGGKVKSLEAPPEVHHLLNVRYRPDALNLFEPLQLSDERLQGLPGQYHVYPDTGLNRGQSRRKRKRGPTELGPQTPLPQNRKGSRATVANPIEKIMQKEICDWLRQHYSNVEAERDFVDIKVERPEGITLIELKSSASALHAIRAALGQILEYAFFHPEWREKLFELIVVGQGLETDESKDFIQWLRREYDLPLRYVSYQRGGSGFIL